MVTTKKLSHTNCGNRAYPGSEFVVPNTLAKREKFEPNEIDFSQDFSQKVQSSITKLFGI